MPYKDPAKYREYNRERMKRKRAADRLERERKKRAAEIRRREALEAEARRHRERGGRCAAYFAIGILDQRVSE